MDDWREEMSDLSKAKAGDKVKFRCGGEAVILYAEPSMKYDNALHLRFDGSNHGINYNVGGELYSAHNGLVQPSAIFNIIAIEPAPFDWATVKPGMAFMYGDDTTIWIYVGHAPDDDNDMIFRSKNDPTQFDFWCESDQRRGGLLVRSSENDIKVKP